jgi:hypothetical protein
MSFLWTVFAETSSLTLVDIIREVMLLLSRSDVCVCAYMLGGEGRKRERACMRACLHASRE